MYTFVTPLRTAVLGLSAIGLIAASAACAPQETPQPAATTSAAGPNCAKNQLATRTPGKLTIATDEPVYPPWFIDNKPENAQGFEGAVADAVASKLGYAQGEVSWVRVTFNNAIAPGPKAFDFDINEFSITDERRQAVDFSAPYYDVTQAVIALKTSKIASATGLAGLKDAKLGAQVGTTSYRAITEGVKPNQAPSVYNNNDDAKQALKNGSIDGLVVDLPTAFYITSAEIDNAVIVGQLPQPSGQPEQFGLVLDKNSPLTACISTAVDALRADGTLGRLQDKWLAQTANARVLT
jgi:polar amino acid transport system substrate-binding protein